MLTAVRPQLNTNALDGRVADRVFNAQVKAVLDPIEVKQYVTLAAEAKVVFFIAESGYGKTFTCSQVDLALRSSKYDTYWVRFSDDASRSDTLVANRIIEKCEEICTTLRRPAVLFIDNLQPLGFEATKAVVETLSHMTDCGASIFITCRPEVTQLVPYFPEALSITNKQLTVPYDEYGEWGPSIRQLPGRDVTSLTRGIPALLAELATATVTLQVDSTYSCEVRHDALLGIIKTSLRSTLTAAERRLRLAMILLGEGSFDDLCVIFPNLHFAQFCNCAHHAPFFGIAQLARKFSCTRVCNDEALELFADELPDIEAADKGVCVAAVSILVAQERYLRAFLLARRYLGCQFVERLFLTYPIELIDAGKKLELYPVVSMTAEAHMAAASGTTKRSSGRIQSSEQDCSATLDDSTSDDKDDNDGGIGVCRDPTENNPKGCSGGVMDCGSAEHTSWMRGCREEFGFGIARIALAIVDGELFAAEAMLSALPRPTTERERIMLEQAEWLTYALKVEMGIAGWDETTPAYHALDDLSADLNTYALGLRGFLNGEFQQTFEDLLPYEHAGEKNSYVRHLIAGLFAGARFMVGDTYNGGAFIDCKRETWLLEHGFSRQVKIEELKNALLRYLQLSLVMRKSNEHDFRPLVAELERSLSAARTLHAVLIELGLYWSSAVLELRQGNYLRGCIHATNGVRKAREIKATALRYKLELVQELCTVGLGDRSAKPVADISINTSAQNANSVAIWSLLMCAWDRKETIAQDEKVLASRGLDQNDALLLAALIEVCPNRKVLQSAMPKSWMQKLKLWSAFLNDDQLLYYAKREEIRQKRGHGKIEVHLLGEFCVLKKGEPIGEKAWHRKKAKELVAILAAQPGHKVERERMIQLLWPDCDEEDGRARLYVTLSAARQALGEKRGEARLIGGHGGHIWLSDELICCDVDSLDKALIGALNVKCEDGKLVGEALKVSDMYVGDMVPIDVDSLLIERRQKELRNKVSDVLIMGARAALRLQTPVRAYWLAERAVCVDDLREDAHNVLIEALLAQGREDEARKYYERFARSQVADMGRPPSRTLRNTMKHYNVSGGRVIKGFGDTAPVYELEGLTEVLG